ncbi:hypothetical protein TRFO_26686 [Tritrichomonas foetus]|uniref:Uncharacterized protein n=1 Tax=Tritrichomonas foetus TaxID=1144522 RepID=A0A1J4K3Y0_9EUKA|nr:hypothetical protein TRFO_26686 [Tritrichomonas foetus]|eukprot:OHT05544.1 hypothetical protein TRFO_26686 [Tritrichomonas foetus]
MTAIEFEIIDEIQAEDQENADSLIIDAQIEKAEKQLRALQKKESQLDKEYESLQEKLDQSNNVNKSLWDKVKSHEKDMPPSGNKQGSFFIQLRHVEAELERWEATKEGLTAVVHNLQGEVSNASAKNQRLRKQVDELYDAYNSAETVELHKKGELKAHSDKLFMQTTERDNLKDIVESLKEKIKSSAHGLKEINPQEAAMLLAQKNFLQKEVNEKTKYLEIIKSEEKNIQTLTAVKRNRRTNSMKNKASTFNWLSERSTLLAKVKKARKDVKMLDATERGVARSTERKQNQIESLNYNSEEVKLALLSEIRSFPTEMPEFMKDALEVEKNFTVKLQKKLAQIDNSFEQIGQFKEDATAVMKLDEDIAQNETRKQLLLDELHMLRKMVL